MAGFAELMWCLPERSPRERLAQIAIRQVIDRIPDKTLIKPDWLRDRVEAVDLTRFGGHPRSGKWA
jgi:hypothetical protein